MFFKTCLQDLPGKPEYKFVNFRDVNPLSGTDKFRNLGLSNKAMTILQKRLLQYVRNLPVKLPQATAFRKKCSIDKNVKKHRNRRYLYIFDIAKAFPSVNIEKLAQIICQIDPGLFGQEKLVSHFLSSYCQHPNGGLVIGANASPALFNLYAGILIDSPLSSLCQKYSLLYSRYSDDLIFSAKSHPIGRGKRRAIRQVVIKAGFSIQHSKAKVIDLNKGPVVINGIGIKRNGDLYIPRSYLRKIRGLIHLARENPDLRPMVHGLMGNFWTFTSTTSFNQTEKKLIQAYRQLQKLEKDQRL
ncbi:MAG: reverse transcriptase domain-containing protein [Patescibacteria group bacterium]|nr:reverse transcriptase domain-containing protein [Patescibacteria group bacterium]